MSYYQNHYISFATIKEALNKYTVDQLKLLLPNLSTDKKPTRKAEIIALIEEHSHGQKLRFLWDKLDSLQQAAVAEVAHSPDSHFEHSRFRAKYGQSPDFGTRHPQYGTLKTISTLGLFIYTSGMPLELKETLRRFVPPPAAMVLQSYSELPLIIEQRWQQFNYETCERTQHKKEIPLEEGLRERSAPQELLAVLRLIDLGKVSVSEKTRLPSAATLRTLTSILEGGDYYTDIENKDNPPVYDEIGSIRAFGWAMLVQAGGLADFFGKKIKLTKAGQKALTDSPAKTIKTIWQKWLKTNILDEFRRINIIKGQTKHRTMTAVPKRRESIVQALTKCPVDRWIEVDDFFSYMQGENYGLEITHDPWNLYIYEKEYGSLGYDGFHNWSMLQGRYVLCLLFEYAATLGIVDVAYISPVAARDDYRGNWGADDLEFLSRYDGLMYFRLTPLGAYCLNLEAHYTPAPLELRPVLQVLPNQEIVAVSGSLSAADALVLDLYAQKVSDVVWRLELPKLLKAAAEGRSIEELTEFLKARTAEPLPQTVEQFLDDVLLRTSSLKDIGSCRVIECIDSTLAVLIANDSRTKKFCFLAGESRLIVPIGSVTKFRNGLQKIGYTLPQLPE
ncbi:hypothetical protein [Roseofilum casamattae]|uniref:Helicase XPB/Ssl2 N-terminal domain-containing protein n=1 Tax=Roseofilum casamattae BLCC-M143 TaxID=3022442 RepID=A0ABT7BY78_9CYAN|nr:hypothetical protein [Roseofilum casamattae]MDJ1184154.1 hypothetical protein [Roseofilum casamattae BLCC-M143]